MFPLNKAHIAETFGNFWSSKKVELFLCSEFLEVLGPSFGNAFLILFYNFSVSFKLFQNNGKIFIYLTFSSLYLSPFFNCIQST
jgi:hypothetical protein